MITIVNLTIILIEERRAQQTMNLYVMSFIEVGEILMILKIEILRNLFLAYVAFDSRESSVSAARDTSLSVF